MDENGASRIKPIRLAPAGAKPQERVMATVSTGFRNHALAADQSRGFALLIVLWTLVLIALLGATLTRTGHREAQIASNLVGEANAEAAADGAVAAAMFHLLIPGNQHWTANGVTHRLLIGKQAVDVVMWDENGMLDPNQSPPQLIAALLRQVGLADTEAQSLAAAIVDWRSPTDSGLLAQYRASTRPFGPPHQPFESVSELGLVYGMTPSILRLIAPHINPFIGTTPDPNLADPLVAAAIQDAQRRDNLSLDPTTPDGPAVVLIQATATGRGDAFQRRAMIRFDPAADPPFTTLDWTAG